MKDILIVSVGGSRKPIIAALRARRPGFALFVASAPDGAQPGSAGEVAPILESAGQANLPHKVLLVPPDNPEQIFLQLREALRQLRPENPKASLLFDYTGGTKSMTSALFQAAIATPGAQLQFMLGQREDLAQVTDGTERPTLLPIEWLVAERTEARLLAAWQGFDYATAATGFEGLVHDLGTDESAPAATRRRLDILAKASHAFDLWDRFRHADAAAALHQTSEDSPRLAAWAEHARTCVQSEPARILDLWRNAERCAARGRYDDAVARLYRLTEWVAQWWLKHKHGIDAGQMDWKRVTEQEVQRAGLSDRRGKKKLSGSAQGWKLIAAKEADGPVARFLGGAFHHRDRNKTGEDRLSDMLELRNRSILAHGAAPLDEKSWKEWLEFAEAMRTKVLTCLLRDAKLPHELPPQLPQRPGELGL